MISVITVCYNEEDHIEETIRSVYDQTFTDMEYIVKDGGSDDGTVKLVMDWERRFREKGIPFTVITGRDDGIYDAMNQAARIAKGEFVNYMNGGDVFLTPDVMERIFSGRDLSGTDLLYGDTVEEEFGELHYFRKCPELIEERMPFSHQSVFVRRELLEKYPFRMEYSIAADYDFLLTLHENGYVFKDSGVAVAKVSKDGTSSLNLKDTYIESLRLRKEHSLPVPEGAALKKKLIWLQMKQFGMDHFPKGLKYMIRKVQRKIRGQKRYDNETA
ncbi:MAG: glycosyltransferase [Lachnospiraceae bacterium]|nr:glycosyltransferase [Lachnospiraceae bacterium]